MISQTSNFRTIEKIYCLILKRRPDHEGLLHWVEFLNKERLSKMLRLFIESEEAKNIYGNEKIKRWSDLLKHFEKSPLSDHLLLFLINISYFARALKGDFRKNLYIIIGNFVLLLTGKIISINLFENKAYSQNGEDGILEAIFKKIGFLNRFCVEIGTEDASECNSRYLIQKYNLQYLMIDGGNYPATFFEIKKEFVTAENINEIMKKYKVPEEFDLLSIDIDYNTFWIWKAINQKYRPRVVVVEYNGTLSCDESLAVKYDPLRMWDGKSNYFGASLLAFVKLAKEKGYTLIGCESKGVNAFFVRNDLRRHFLIRDYRKLYKKFASEYIPAKEEFIPY